MRNNVIPSSEQKNRAPTIYFDMVTLNAMNTTAFDWWMRLHHADTVMAAETKTKIVNIIALIGSRNDSVSFSMYLFFFFLLFLLVISSILHKKSLKRKEERKLVHKLMLTLSGAIAAHGSGEAVVAGAHGVRGARINYIHWNVNYIVRKINWNNLNDKTIESVAANEFLASVFCF